MSRAFVKENDGDLPDDLPELPASEHPNYVTARGLRLLRERLDAALARQQAIDPEAVGAMQQKAHLAREIRWLQARLASTLPVPEAVNPQKVGIGVVVELRDDEGMSYRYRIVGEDEADPEQGYLSWTFPLARALDQARVGDEVCWPRPAGDRGVEVVGISAAP